MRPVLQGSPEPLKGPYGSRSREAAGGSDLSCISQLFITLKYPRGTFLGRKKIILAYSLDIHCLALGKAPFIWYLMEANGGGADPEEWLYGEMESKEGRLNSA